MQNQLVAVQTLDREPALLVRGAHNHEVVSEYAERMTAGDEFPPVIVYTDGSAWWLADGLHRCTARLKAGFADVAALVQSGTRADAIRYAIRANAAHGLRRSNADKRRAVRAALDLAREEGARVSAREIARMCEVSHSLVNSVISPVSSERRPPLSPPPPPPVDATQSPAGEDGAMAELRDGRGNLITDERIAEAFRNSDRLDEALRQIRAAGRFLESLASEPAWATLRTQQIETALRHVRTAIRAARPYALCPYRPNCVSGCGCCSGRGWITEDVFVRVPPELQR